MLVWYDHLTFVNREANAKATNLEKEVTNLGSEVADVGNKLTNLQNNVATKNDIHEIIEEMKQRR